MKPKEKAGILVAKFIKHSRAEKDIKPIQSAKECALICAKEIWDELESARVFEEYEYWQEVEKEIEKL
jgi:hypothetical protein